MKAAEFYSNFEESFNAQALPTSLRKMGGKTPKWSLPIQNGALHFKVSTDFKGAGLLANQLWPGEHRMCVAWVTGRGKDRRRDMVSLFQYTTAAEVASFAEIQRDALVKYLGSGCPDPYGTLREYLTSDLALPKPNVHVFYFYFDAHDAKRWGEWYGAILDSWVSRFEQQPEINEDWAWRVLWPHLERKRRPGEVA
jgi:hypothetical protein